MNFSKPFAFFLLLLLLLSTAVFADQSLPQQKGDEVKEPNKGEGGGGGGGYCRNRKCCGGWHNGRCKNWCCSSLGGIDGATSRARPGDRPADADLEVIKPSQGGGGGGGGGGYCRYRRCCGGYYGDSCRKWCCSHPVDEAEQAQLVEDSSYNGGGGYGGGGYGGGGHGGGGGGYGGGGGGHCKYGCCGGHGGGGGYGGCKCCGSAAEAKAFMESKGNEEIKN